MKRKATAARVIGRLFGFSSALFVFITLVYFFLLNHLVSQILGYFEWVFLMFLVYAAYLTGRGIDRHEK